ncbi:MAG: glycoside hydrolase family 3 protein [Deltaproteobacteria bacterium]|nr:MAG: glycoside hydrolase family 3 protein [Deltaproteobacteria bacterium]
MRTVADAAIFLLACLAAASAAESPAVAASLDLSLEQKVGQLLMVGLSGKRLEPEAARLLRTIRPGAVILYSRNISSTSQLRRFAGEITRAMENGVIPFLAVDQEGGNVVRVRYPATVIPGAMALGATGDTALAFLAGVATGADLRQLGITMNLAPVLDVNTSAANSVINVRAFSDDAVLVGKLGSAYMLGQQQSGVAAVAKHFPGHGDTAIDSHYGLPVVRIDEKALLDRVLLPFRYASAVGLDALLVGHVAVPSVDPSGAPASLSEKLISGILRNRLGFDGLVVTDDMEMHAVADRYGTGEAAVRSVLAGSDMVMVAWTPSRKYEAFNALLEAVRSGRIPRRRLEEAVARILSLKRKYGLLASHHSNVQPARPSLPVGRHQKIARTIARRSVTLVFDRQRMLPLPRGSRLVVASALSHFLGKMKELFPRSVTLKMQHAPSRRKLSGYLERLGKLAAGSDAVVVGVSNRYHAWLVQRLYRKTSTPVIVVSFASPYLVRYFRGVAAYLCTYSYQPLSQLAVAEALAGRISITGKLPVTIGRGMKRGGGLVLRASARRRPPGIAGGQGALLHAGTAME